MSYLILVLCHNEVHYIKLFESKLEAEFQAIELANDWYLEGGVNESSQKPFKTINEIAKYYQSEAYLDNSETSHVVLEELEI